MVNYLAILVLVVAGYFLYNSGAVFLGSLAVVAAILWLLVESQSAPAKSGGGGPQYAYPPYPPYPTEIKFKPDFGGGDPGPVAFAKNIGGILNAFVKLAWGITRGADKKKED
ncbi:MAG TPA: hypothetical protein VGQ00_02375 [Candidatus Norongarragalinales archaeon]|jgi:hypothetical protein|nr:hypothetical protein [Candidatus Norongarragalinales archaeon]